MQDFYNNTGQSPEENTRGGSVHRRVLSAWVSVFVPTNERISAAVIIVFPIDRESTGIQGTDPGARRASGRS